MYFVTTLVDLNNGDYQPISEGILHSLKKIKVTYPSLLVHWPHGYKALSHLC